MIPKIAIIGRSNVGKSTLFNKLTKDQTLVDNQPNLTRDRKYGYLIIKKYSFLIIDTAGIKNIKKKNTMEKRIFEQTEIAILEANLVLLVLNMKDGIMHEDEKILHYIRKKKKDIFLIINKIDKIKKYNFLINEYYKLGIKNVILISALLKKGIKILIQKYLLIWYKNYINEYKKINKIYKKKEQNYDNLNLKISIVGKPNVGKSTLLNTILNKKRVITNDESGTTRDNIAVPIFFKNKKYTVIDTAGIKKKNKELIELSMKFNTIQSILKSHVSILILDAIQGISRQDINILNIIINSGKTLIILINKSENISLKEKNRIKEILYKKNKLIKFININFISALYKKGLKKIFPLINKIYLNTNKKIKPSKLTKIMYNAILKNPLPYINGKKIRLKYAHIGGYNPIIIIIHGNKILDIPSNYKRYLTNFFQKSLNIYGNCIKLIFKNNNNPYIYKKKIND